MDNRKCVITLHTSNISLTYLCTFAGSKLKWNREKTDEVLLPVMKRLSEKQVNFYINILNSVGN
jgi:hypothetical protein